MLPDKDTRDIQAYLDDTLPQVRRDKFELRLQNDLEFKARFEELKPILETIGDIQYENRIRKIVEEIGQTKPEIRPIKKIQSPYVRIFQYVAAACILLFLGIVWYDSTSNNRLYSEYYNPETAFRGNTIEGCPDENTLNLYYKKEYNNFLNATEKSPQTLCTNYYKGLCLLELSEIEKAKCLFSTGINSDDIYIKQSSEWYLALSLIKLGEEQKAIEMLQKIINIKGHQYEVVAKNLLLELQKKPILFRVKL